MGINFQIFSMRFLACISLPDLETQSNLGVHRRVFASVAGGLKNLQCASDTLQKSTKMIITNASKDFSGDSTHFLWQAIKKALRFV